MKSQSNSEIAGSPRNSFRASVDIKTMEGRALNGRGAFDVTKIYQTPNVQ